MRSPEGRAPEFVPWTVTVTEFVVTPWEFSTSHGNCQTPDRYEGEGTVSAKLVADSDQGVARLFQQGSSPFVICRLDHQNVPIERRDDEYRAPRR
jgi:hypothetical protein